MYILHIPFFYKKPPHKDTAKKVNIQLASNYFRCIFVLMLFFKKKELSPLFGSVSIIHYLSTMDDLLLNITVKPSVLQKVTRTTSGGGSVTHFINVSELPQDGVVQYHNEYVVYYSPHNTTLKEM